MEQRDHLMDQFRQLGSVLAHLLGRLMGASDLAASTAVDVENELAQLLELESDAIAGMDPDVFAHRIISRQGFVAADGDRLAELLIALADARTMHAPAHARDLRVKSLTLLEYLDRTSQDFSVERRATIDRLQRLLR